MHRNSRLCLAIVCAAVGVLPPAAAAAGGHVFVRPKAAEGFAYPDTFCTNRGQKVALGETSCLVVDGQARLATCEMVQNVPAWRSGGDTCEPSTLTIEAVSK